jgi:outer membrane protein OmpA-like peptidoglycan-associated protein
MSSGSPRARIGLVLAVAAVALGAPVTTWGQDDTAAAGPGKVLDIVPKVLDIVGISAGIEGALADLGAEVTEKEIKIALSGDILFDFDKDTLRPDAFPTLEKIAAVLSEYPDAPVLIEGHTDSKGKEKYNQDLSERRANSVKAWFVDNTGADAGRIETKGWGEAKPAVPNEKSDGSDDPDGRQQNRRVEITIKTG